MRERIIQQVARAPEGVCPQCGTDYSGAYPSPDDITNQILSIICEEIEKKGAIKSRWAQRGSKIKNFGVLTMQDSLELYDKEGITGVMEKASEVAAHAQLQKILGLLRSK